VNSALGLYERFRHLIHEALKFGFVGGIAFVVTVVGTNVLHFDTGLGPLTSNVIASIVATFVSYAGNRYWTFRHREAGDIGRDYAIFFALNAVGILIQLACVGFTYYALGLTDKLSYNVALAFGIGLGTLFRFWSYRKWVWRSNSGETLEGHEALEPAGAAGTPAASQPRVSNVDEA
jgi:putative flippase GtrA